MRSINKRKPWQQATLTMLKLL
ncbi:uL30 family ribosomal protein [uncultured Psychrobacter sp.]